MKSTTPRYITPERRHIQQMVFPNAEDARAAAERIAKGTSFAEVAKERGLTDKDIDLGTLAKSAVIDRAVADAAFALKEGEVSAPVQGRFGTALVQVLKIEPESVRPLEDVSAELKRELALERAKADILKLYDKIEDARIDGKTLTELAEDSQAFAAHGGGHRPVRPRAIGPADRRPRSAAAVAGGIFGGSRGPSATRCSSMVAMCGSKSPASPRRMTARSMRSRSRSRRAGASRRSRLA